MGAVHGHGFRKTHTEMPVGLTEIVQVGRRMLRAGLNRAGQKPAWVDCQKKRSRERLIP